MNRLVPALAIAMVGVVATMVAVGASDDRVSKPGMYSGYSRPLYTEWVRSSRYVPVRDGTKIAIDLYRPATNGTAVTTPYPVVWHFTPYRRGSYGPDGKMILTAERTGMLDLTKYGYVVAVADVRGKGASYGTRRAMNDRTEALDAYDITEWLAAQPWSSGKVGMWGGSYTGQTPLEAASTRPPHLRAIFFQITGFDAYDSWSRNGILRKFGGNPDEPLSAHLATVRVDEDVDGSMLKAAVAQHEANTPSVPMYKELPFRDSISSYTGRPFWIDASASTYLAQLKASGIGFYHAGGWNDVFRRDAMLFPANLGGKLLMGPGGHGGGGTGGLDMTVEHLRFFDYWLKGIENGIMREPPISYFTINAPAGAEWQSATSWPLPDTKSTTFYLSGGQSGSASSTNDGVLGATAPAVRTAKDDYAVAYDITDRGDVYNVYDKDDSNRDEKGLTYTTAPLPADVQVTGHPLVHLWVSSSATDGDFFAYLEDVDAQGSRRLVADGRLRASHRAVRQPPYNFLGLPWHPSRKQDAVPLTPGTPAELVFDLMPTSTIFKVGHRIRLAITCADPGVEGLITSTPPPTVSVYRERARASRLELPVRPAMALSAAP